MAEILLNEQQKKTVEEFARALAMSQAVSYVAIVKEEGRPAAYRTGGYKTAGPTVVDMAKAVGVICAELAQVVMNSGQVKGDMGWDDILQMIFDAVAEGAENARVTAGSTNLREVDPPKRPPLPGPGSAPRGF